MIRLMRSMNKMMIGFFDILILSSLSQRIAFDCPGFRPLYSFTLTTLLLSPWSSFRLLFCSSSFSPIVHFLSHYLSLEWHLIHKCVFDHHHAFWNCIIEVKKEKKNPSLMIMFHEEREKERNPRITVTHIFLPLSFLSTLEQDCRVKKKEE